MNDLPTVKTWTGKKIRDYGQGEFANQLKRTLAEIVLITGGKIYDETTQPAMYKSQLNSIIKLISYSFSFFSFEEIVNAFYLNSAGKFEKIHSHFGRELNVEFLGTVLACYKKYKQELFNQHGSDLVKAVKGELPAPEQKILTEEDYLNDKRQDIENAYQALIKNLYLNESLFPEYFYDVLEMDGAIEKGIYEKRLKQAKEKIEHQSHVEIMFKEAKLNKRNNGVQIEEGKESASGLEKEGRLRYDDDGHIRTELEKLRWMAKEGLLKKHRPVVVVSKQAIVKEYFMYCLRKNVENIYVSGK